MKLISLELDKCTRLALNNINKFIFKPTEREQVILGTNGSGKSSLVDEISPLSAENDNYLKEGGKKQVFHHRNSIYELSSVVGSGVKHSFIKNGEELNPGGTGIVQKTLIWQEFKYNQEVHNLVTGKEKFTDMSPARRREWFTRLSDVDFDYAIGVYNKAKEVARDTSGALKLAKKRLVAEKAAVMSDDEKAFLSKELEGLRLELQALQELRAPVNISEDNIGATLNTQLQTIRRLVAQTGDVERAQATSLLYGGIEKIDEFLNVTNTKLTSVETEIDLISKEDEKLSKSIELLTKAGAGDVSELTDKKAGVVAQITQMKTGLRFWESSPDPLSEIAAFQAVKEVLFEVFANIPDNTDKKYSSQAYEELKAKLFETQEKLSQIKHNITAHETRKQHAEEHSKNGAVNCPKCNHTFKPGFSEIDLANIVKWLEKAYVTKAGFEKELLELAEKVQEFDSYRKHYSDYIRCFKNNQPLGNLNKFIFENNLITNSPRRVLPLLVDYEHDLEIHIQISLLESKLNDIETLISRSSELTGASLSGMKEKQVELYARMELLVNERNSLVKQRGTYQDDKKVIQTCLRNADQLKELIESYRANICTSIEMRRRKMLNDVIMDLQLMAAKKADALAAVDRQCAVIADLEKSIAKLEIDEEAAKLLVAELSPTEGLIAEGLLSFIRNFTANMNYLIRKIWAYPLQVLECGSSDENGAELNYKFPLLVQSKENIKSDVKFGSTAMQEIVNLVFRVTAMRYLDLDDGILVLDEFGASFDEVHRASAVEMVKTLMEQQNFSQLFMVSHYLSSYGAFQNAEVCVLCSTNITVPTNNFNHHVVIE